MWLSVSFVLIIWCILYIFECTYAKPYEEFMDLKIDEDSVDLLEDGSKLSLADIRKGNKKSLKLRNCLDVQKQRKGSGIYMIYPCDHLPSKVVKVYCDMETDGGGWTVIQRRNNFVKQQKFDRSWLNYKLGFGDLSRDFWLGNDNIHCLTEQSYNELKIDLEDWEGTSKFAAYDFFYVYDETMKYKLAVEGYTGDANDSLTYHSGMSFSTFDADNDIHSSNCASRYKGGWWYRECHYANLNGLYNTSSSVGINWYHWKGHGHSMKKTEMKIRSKFF